MTDGIRRAIRRAFGLEAIVGNLIWAAILLLANWAIGQVLEWSLETQIIVGISSTLLVAAALFAWRNRASRMAESPSASARDVPSQAAAISPSGSLRLKSIRDSREVREELVLAEWDTKCEFVSYGSTPRSNTLYWGPKLDRNVERDRRVDARLLREGWRVLRIWEHEPAEQGVELVRLTLSGDPRPR